MEQPRLPVIVMSTRYEVAALVHRALDAPDAPDAHIELLADPSTLGCLDTSPHRRVDRL